MPPLLLVMVGGAIGSGFRYQIGRIALPFGSAFPWGTWIVNLVGGFLMGVLAGVLARHAAAESLRLLLGVGVLGGFTTFSAFTLETSLMLQRGAFGAAAGYALLSVIGALFALFLGLSVSRILA